MNTNKKILLIVAFMLMGLTAAIIVNVAINFRDYSYSSVVEKSNMTAELVRDGLTAHMVNGIMDKRNFFLKNIANYREVEALWIVRSQLVDKQYGAGLSQESPRDRIDKEVLRTGKTVHKITENSKTAKLRVSIPYVAASLDTPDCMTCHDVKEGDVLGVISMVFDISHTRDVGMMTIAKIFAINLLFIIVALFLTNHYFKPYMQVFSDLTDMIKHANRGDYSYRITRKIRGEGAKVVLQINTLFASMQETYNQLKNNLNTFVSHSNTSHSDPLEESKNIINELADIYKFKKTIELDKDKYAIYARIYHLLQGKFNLKHFAMYEVNHNRKTRNLLYISHDKSFCLPSADDDATECRAFRTSTDIISSDFPDLCLSCTKNGEVEYICLPFNINSSYSLILSISEKTEKEIAVIDKKVDTIKNYFEAAKPVIESKILMDILRESSLRDGLTDLYNRRFLEEYIEQEQASIKRENVNLDILMIDIDYFKLVNDTYGHDVGDTVIKALADILKSSIRQSDMAIRYGGEEFLVLLRRTTHEATMKIASEIHSKFAEKKFNIGSETLEKTLSIGIAKLADDSDSIWKVIKYADTALYRAKNTGRNKIVEFTSDMFDGY